MYPNPAATDATPAISTAGDIHYLVKVQDVLGRLMYQQNIGVNNEVKTLLIPLLQLTSGIYHIVVSDDQDNVKNIRFRKLK